MATTEPGISAPASPSDVGRHLRAVRKAKGLSRAEVARSAGLTRRELAAYERGRAPVPDSDLWCLAGSCGVDVGELVPPIDRISVGSDLGALTVGESVARLRPVPGNDGVLREYLAMVYELRNLPPGAKPPMRDDDLATLAEALGGTPEAIEARLHELIGASREEAARLRSLILPPRPIAAAGPAEAPVDVGAAMVGVGAGLLAPPPPVPVGVGAATMAGGSTVTPLPAPTPFAEPAAAAAFAAPAPPAAFAEPTPYPAPAAGLPPLTAAMPPTATPATAFVAPGPATPAAGPTATPAPAFVAPGEPSLPSYPPPTFDFASPAATIGDPDAADRFFSAPHADDPFAPPPPLEALTPPAGAAFPPPAPAFPTLAPSFTAPGATDGPGFAPPSGPTIDPFAPPTGPPLGAPAPAAADPLTDPFGVPYGPLSGAAPPPLDPFASPTGAPTRPDGFVADLGTDYPDATLPAFGETFDPVHDATFDAPVPGALTGAFDAPGDPFGAVEMVVLDVAPDGTVVEPGAAAPDALAAGATPDAGPAEVDDDDPFAVLRIPLDDVDTAGAADPAFVLEPSPLDGFAPGAAEAGWTDVLAHEAPDATGPDPYRDAFADAFDPAEAVPPAPTTAVPVLDAAVASTVVDGTEFGSAVDPNTDLGLAPTVVEPEREVVGDDDPGDDWFDRAAAAAAALIAEQRHDAPPPVLLPDPDPDPDPLPDSDPLPPHTADELAAPVTADLAPDAPTAPTDVVATVEPAVAAPAEPDADAALAPIAWSLGAPAGAPATATTPLLADLPGAGEFVAAGADWQVGGIFPATAMADDGTLALRRADVRWALADVSADGDFTIRADVGFTSGAGFGILFRVSTDDTERITGYSFDVDPIYSGGGFLVRQWNDSRQHWKPLAHAPVADPTRLFGKHLLEVSLRNDTLTAHIDGEPVMHVDRLSRCSLDAGHEPCRGGRIGVQAWSTTEVTVDKLLVARH